MLLAFSDYRNHHTTQPADTSPAAPVAPDAPQEAPQGDRVSDEPVSYRANAFCLQLPGAAWTDESVYTITGPIIDGVNHNITIITDDEVEADSVYDFAAKEIATLEPLLDDCRVLMHDPVELDSGEPAYRAIFCWYPKEDLKLYQEQIYVLHDGCGYTLTASFTARTRKTLGPEVEQMMRSFTPRNR